MSVLYCTQYETVIKSTQSEKEQGRNHVWSEDSRVTDLTFLLHDILNAISGGNRTVFVQSHVKWGENF